jgi:hypothetical protein
MQKMGNLLQGKESESHRKFGVEKSAECGVREQEEARRLESWEAGRLRS